MDLKQPPYLTDEWRSCVSDLDREFERLCVDRVHPSTDQAWGPRAMMFRDTGGHPVNVSSRLETVAS